MGGFLQKIMSVSSFDRSMDFSTHDFGCGVFRPGGHKIKQILSCRIFVFNIPPNQFIPQIKAGN